MVMELGSFKFFWDLLIILLAIFNCSSIPFMLAYQHPVMFTQTWSIINWVITGIFAADLLINFRTTYVDGSKHEIIYDWKLCALNYLISFRLWLDLISTIPFEVIFVTGNQDTNTILSALGMFRIYKTTRISSLITRLKFTQEVKAFCKILQIIFYMILFVHIQGCLISYFVIITYISHL